MSQLVGFLLFNLFIYGVSWGTLRIVNKNILRYGNRHEKQFVLNVVHTALALQQLCLVFVVMYVLWR